MYYGSQRLHSVHPDRNTGIALLLTINTDDFALSHYVWMNDKSLEMLFRALTVRSMSLLILRKDINQPKDIYRAGCNVLVALETTNTFSN